MKKQQYVYVYECPKCKFHKDIINGNEDYNIKCKICNTEMIFKYKNPYNPNMALKAMKDRKRSNMTINIPQSQQFTSIPKCPTCGSTNIKKIGTMSKIVGASMFGLFSKAAMSQFRCGDCGYKW